MKKAGVVVAHTLALAACVLAVVLGIVLIRRTLTEDVERRRLQQAVADLTGRLVRAESDRGAAQRKAAQLDNDVAALSRKAAEDRQLIQDIWAVLVRGAQSTTRETAGGRKPSLTSTEATHPVDPDRSKATVYDVNQVKKMAAASGGNLDAVVHGIVTPDGLGRWLEDHPGQPAYWVAAASLASDPETALRYLQEAARLYPDSAALLAALVSAQVAAGQTGESTLASIRRLERLDPTNALADCYAAYCQFQSGDLVGALQALAQASAKGRLADDRIAVLMARYEALLNQGVSDPVALGLSAFTLPLEHMGVISQLGRDTLDRVRALSAAGQTDAALKAAQDLVSLGRMVSSSGRFLVYDRVGMQLQQEGLIEQRRLYEGLGNAAALDDVGSRLQAVVDRAAMIDVMVHSFGSVLAGMTENDLAAYVDGTILNGEFATLQRISEIAEALRKAQASRTPQKPETAP